MPTQTFPCPFCGKKMGVGIELLGRKVRCPHCNQILLAPDPAAAQPLQPQPTPPDIPKFNLPSSEARESIFGEQPEEGDEVFGQRDSNKPLLPEMPPSEKVPTIEPEPPKKESAPPQLSNDPTVEMSSPFGNATPGAVPPPVVASVPASSVASPSSFGVNNNPWAGMEQLPPAPTPVPALSPLDGRPFDSVETPLRRSLPDEGSPKRVRGAPAPVGSPLFKVGFFILAPYAVIVTVAAVYGLFFKSSLPVGHPLANLPDNFGEYGPAERRKTGRLPAVDGELPAEQKVALGAGSKLEIGQLEIEPIAVHQRTLKLVSEGKSGGGKSTETPLSPALVLTLRIRNRSDDTAIHPLDPAFNRRIVGSERCGTGLIIVGKDPFWGGAINWPFPEKIARQYEVAQELDSTPLKPGETRDYVVFTDASQRIVKAVRDATEPILWRIHVRRGRIDFNGKDIPVTAIIGVEFKSSDVKLPG